MTRFEKHLKYIILFLFTIVGANIFAQQKPGYINSLKQQNHWVDSVYKKLNRKQRIAQLFFVRAHTNRGQAYEDSVGNVIKNEQLGGLVFFQGGPVRQVQLSNKYTQFT